jgi:hypothetical protein
MFNLKNSVLLLATSLFVTVNVFAQEVEVEAHYEISGKAKRGVLNNVEYDENGYRLSYVTRSSSRKIIMEHYSFDNNFKFQKVEDERIDLVKAKTKYRWFKGEEEGTAKKLLRVENNMTGQVVLKEGSFVQRCNYTSGVCWWDFKVGERTKPKDASGRRLSLIAYSTDEPQTEISYSGWSWLASSNTKSFSDATGDLTIVTSVLPRVKDAKKGITVPPYAIMRISVDDKSIEKESYFGVDEFKGKPQHIVFKQTLDNGNIAIVFAPSGGPGLKKVQDNDPLNWRFIEIDAQTASIKKSIPFKSLNSYWNINAIVAHGDDLYIYGPSENKKNEKHANLVSGGKFTQFCMAKVAGNKMAWIENTNIEQFATKLQGPPGQKKTPEYTGKKFALGTFFITKSGDILINGQNLKVKDDGTVYKDIFAFHFGTNGKLKAQYGLDILETNKYAKATPTTSLFRETQDGKSVAWIVLEVAGFKMYGKQRPLVYSRIGKIDVANAKLGEFKSIGYSKESKNYLEPTFPILPTIVDGDKLTFFGSDKKGRNLWFSRVKL